MLRIFHVHVTMHMYIVYIVSSLVVYLPRFVNKSHLVVSTTHLSVMEDNVSEYREPAPEGLDKAD